MELFDHLREVGARLELGLSEALRLMGADMTDFFLPEALEAFGQDPYFSVLFLLAGQDLSEGGNAYNKDRQKIHRVVQQTAHIYTGVPDKLAKWGHEAHGAGAHAFGMEQGGKAPHEKMVQAHQNAVSAHQGAEMKLRAGGYHSAADMHKHAASFHTRRMYALQAQMPGKKAANEDIQEALEALRAELAEDGFDDARMGTQRFLSRRAFNATLSADSPPQHKAAADMHRQAADAPMLGGELKAKHTRMAASHDRLAKYDQGAPIEMKIGLASAPHWPGPEVLADPNAPINKRKNVKPKPVPAPPSSVSQAAEDISDPAKAAHDAQVSAHMANWRATKLKQKLGQMPKRPAALQSTQMIGGVSKVPRMGEALVRLRQRTEWSGLDEAGKYADEVKRASKIAAAASAVAKDNGTPEQHGTASRLHFIASGVAKAHGHEDLAAKHHEMHKQHAVAADAARSAGVGT